MAISCTLQKRAREAVEQLRQGLAFERERAHVRRPREFIASRHRRHPDLPNRSVRRDDELRLCRFLEHEVQHAILQLHFEAFAVRKRQERTPCGFERFITLYAEFLLGEGHDGVSKPLSGSPRLSKTGGKGT